MAVGLRMVLAGNDVQELIMAVRRQSKGFSRGSSNFRGVTRHPSGTQFPACMHTHVPCICIFPALWTAGC
jgi:hypothetical protein